jgi:pimeloyl-ACP methyl ester carboxylesterase
MNRRALAALATPAAALTMLLCPAQAAQAGSLTTPPSCMTSQLLQVPGVGQKLVGSVPVVFIHGINSSSAMWEPSSPASIAGQAALIKGVTVWTFDYAYHSLDWVDNQSIGPAFADAISCLSRASGHKVIVVAHSMGGLATQYAVGYPGSPAVGDVAQLITIGTPYLGSVLLSAMQAAVGLSEAGSLPDGPENVVLAEALLSACAGIATHTDSNPCSLVSVLRSPVGTALQWHSPQIQQLPPWPRGLPVLDTAGDVRIQITVGGRTITGNFGDVPVSLGSATAHDTAGPAYVRHCSPLTLLGAVLLNPGPCFHTHLPNDGDIIAVVLAAIRADVVVRLAQRLVPVPPIGQDYNTSGDYLQVVGVPGLDTVNTALRNLIVAEQEPLVASERNRSWPPGVGPGIFDSEPHQGQISASSAVVSALIPVTALLPGGTDGELWASGTFLVPSAQPVMLPSLFTNPSQGMAALAALTKAGLLAADSCVRQAIESPYGGPWASGFDPTPGNYRHFALTPAGITIGFDNGMVADAACGRAEITISWDQLRPYLSPLGNQLSSELR